MDVSHIIVIGLTAISLGLLVWIEIRSRRNHAGQPAQNFVPARIAEATPPAKGSDVSCREFRGRSAARLFSTKTRNGGPPAK